MSTKRPVVYLAASFVLQEEMRAHRYVLQDMGYEVCAHWIDENQVEGAMGVAEVERNPHRAIECATTDMIDIMHCDMFLLFTTAPSTSGGRHTELGIAMALHKLITIIGPRENVFQSPANFSQYPDWESFLTALKEANGATTTRPESIPADIPAV